MLKNRWHALVVAGALLITCTSVFAPALSIVDALAGIGHRSSQVHDGPNFSETLAGDGSVVASGILVPAGELIHLSGGSAFQGARLQDVFVQEGQWVRAGQPIARCDTYDADLATCKLANSKVAVAKARLAQVLASAKRQDLDAQQANCDSAASELATASRECARYTYLYREGAVTASAADQKQLDENIAREKLAREQAILQSMLQSKPADVALAEAQLRQSQLEEAQALSRFQQDTVRAPIAGCILELNTRKGEQPSSSGLCTMGATSDMCADLEVFDADLHKVRLGQPVELTSAGLEEPLRGHVFTIGSIVDKKVLADEDPAQDIDARVIKVRVKLIAADSKRAAHLSNLRVTARIDAKPA